MEVANAVFASMFMIVLSVSLFSPALIMITMMTEIQNKSYYEKHEILLCNQITLDPYIFFSL